MFLTPHNRHLFQETRPSHLKWATMNVKPLSEVSLPSITCDDLHKLEDNEERRNEEIFPLTFSDSEDCDNDDVSLEGSTVTSSASVCGSVLSKRSSPGLPPLPKKQNVIKSEADAEPLPDPFPLPKHFGSEVEVALKSKTMTNVSRQAFISKVAAAMFCYKRYPSGTDYENVGRSIIQEYPFLKSSVGSPAVITDYIILFLCVYIFD